SLLAAMQTKIQKVNYKFLDLNAKWLLGSNTDNKYFQDSAIQQKFNIATSSQKRNKRLLDVFVAIALFLISPLYMLIYKNSQGLFSNIIAVILGNRTWVSYEMFRNNTINLPQIKQGILMPFNMIKTDDLSNVNIDYLLYKYAKD